MMLRSYGLQRFWATNSTFPCDHQNQLDKPSLIYCVTWLCKFFPLPYGLFRGFYKLKPKLVSVTNKNVSKSLKFTLSIAVHWSALAKNHFWHVATQKKRIGEQLNDFWNMCPKPFSWAKNKKKLFSDGKSRGPLLAGAALKPVKRRMNGLWHGATKS